MERLIAIKITSDGRAFVVDQAANAQAARKLEEQLQATGKEADTTAAKVNRLGKEVKDTTTPVSQAACERFNRVKSSRFATSDSSTPMLAPSAAR